MYTGVLTNVRGKGSIFGRQLICCSLEIPEKSRKFLLRLFILPLHWVDYLVKGAGEPLVAGCMRYFSMKDWGWEMRFLYRCTRVVIFGDCWFFKIDLFLRFTMMNSWLQRKSTVGFRRRQEIVDENLGISQEVNRHGYSDNSRLRNVKFALITAFSCNSQGI